VQHVIDGASHNLRATLDDKRSVPARVVAADAKSGRRAGRDRRLPNRPVARNSARRRNSKRERRSAWPATRFPTSSTTNT
jgi:S1-C subfamily serine protease